MSFLYVDVMGTGTDSEQYKVLCKGIDLGIVMKLGRNWVVFRPGSNTQESEDFSDKADAAKYLAKLAGLNWRS